MELQSEYRETEGTMCCFLSFFCVMHGEAFFGWVGDIGDSAYRKQEKRSHVVQCEVVQGARQCEIVRDSAVRPTTAFDRMHVQREQQVLPACN